MKKTIMLSALFVAGALCVPAMGAAKKEAKPANKIEVKPAPKATAKAKAKAPKEDVWASLPNIVAYINGKPVMKSEIIQMMMSQFPDGKLPPNITADIIKSIAYNLVDDFVVAKIMKIEMAKAGFKPSKALAEKEIKKELQSLTKEQLDQLNKQLSIQKLTMDKHIDQLASNPGIQQRFAFQLFAKSTFLKNITVTPAEVKKFYDENPQYFTTPAQVSASHILIMCKSQATAAEQKAALAKINEIKAQLKKNPAAFNDLAKKESKCPSGKNGGSLGTFGKGQMVKEFEDVAFKLKEGEISDIVKTQFGYHIIRCDAVKKSKIIPFDTVKDSIAQLLKDQKSPVAYMEYLNKIKKQYKVIINIKKPAPQQTPMLPGQSQ